MMVQDFAKRNKSQKLLDENGYCLPSLYSESYKQTIT